MNVALQPTSNLENKLRCHLNKVVGLIITSKKQETRGINTTKGARQCAIKGAANQQAEYGDAQEVEAQANESARGARLRTNTGFKHKKRRNATCDQRRNEQAERASLQCTSKGKQWKVKGKCAFPRKQDT
jgi:hypothetical protein